MKKLITSLGIVTLIVCTAASCNSKKETVEKKTAKGVVETTTVDKTPKTGVGNGEAVMITGTIVYSEVEGDCAYAIKTDDGRMFDPVNLEDAYKKDGAKIAFKFTGLRMMNRCTKADPVNIDQIKMQ